MVSTLPSRKKTFICPEPLKQEPLRILLGSSSSVMRGLLRRLMEAEGYTVFEAADGEELLNQFSAAQPNLMLIDDNLSRVDSLTCCQIIRKSVDNLVVPILLLDGGLSEGEINAAFAAGINDCIPPTELTLLRQKVRCYLESSRQVAELHDRLKQADWLRTITHQVHSSFDPEKILNAVTAGVQNYLKADRVLVYRIQPDGSSEPLSEAVNATHLRIKDSLASTCSFKEDWHELFFCDRVSVVEDTHRELTHSCYAELPSCLEVRASLAVPILLNSSTASPQELADHLPFTAPKKLWGLLVVQKSVPYGWQNWEINLLRGLTSEMAIALHRADLYQTSQAQAAKLMQMQAEKNDLISTVSHELRAPLSNMRLAIQMLEQMISQQRANHDSPDPISEKITAYLQVLKQECSGEIALINDLLDLQRLASEGRTNIRDNIDLQTWIPEVAAAFNSRTNDRHQTLHLNLEPKLPVLLADAGSLKRVLVELLNNACKYSPAQGEITLSVRALSRLQISVTNTGVDIPAKEVSRIFDRFYRIPGGDRWNQGGTGLGLTLVQNLVNSLGGFIKVESHSGKTKFTVEIPF